MTGNNEINRHAVLSLTFGVLSIMIPFLGVAFSIIGMVFARKALNEIKQSNESGNGLAHTGFICGLVGIVIQLFILLGIISFYSLK